MKKALLAVLMAFMAYSCSAQQKVDLQKLTFNEDARIILKGRMKTADRIELTSSLPAYKTSDVGGFIYGSVPLVQNCSVSFLLNSVEEKKLVGLIIEFGNTKQSRAVYKYVFQSYGKPVVLQKETQETDSHNKPYKSSSAFLWRNIRPGVSLLLYKYYVFEDGMPIENTNLTIVNNDQKLSVESNYKTVLNRLIASLTVNLHR